MQNNFNIIKKTNKAIFKVLYITYKADGVYEALCSDSIGNIIVIPNLNSDEYKYLYKDENKTMFKVK